jgi:phospholipid/cholesterol/gamma-HCH transport system ATP-binding protein
MTFSSHCPIEQPPQRHNSSLQPTPERYAIRVRDLIVGFGDRIVIDRLSLDVRQGEVLGLVGGSGSGKSVLLRTIIGLLPKHSGSIEIFGADRDLLNDEETISMGRRWGILFQHGALFSSLSVKENIQFPMREHFELPQELMDEVARSKLEMVGLSKDDADKFPSELSGGMTKRVALARALALDPELLFLDEPTSGLDPISAGDFDMLLKTLHRALGFTVLMVTHDLQSLLSVCDRVAALDDGKIVEIGPLQQLVKSEHPWVKSYFRGTRGAEILHEGI